MLPINHVYDTDNLQQHLLWLNTLRPGKMTSILRATFSNSLSWMEIVLFWFNFHWNLFPMIPLTICKHWFRQWIGVNRVTYHYLKQWRFSLLTQICVTRPQSLRCHLLRTFQYSIPHSPVPLLPLPSITVWEEYHWGLQFKQAWHTENLNTHPYDKKKCIWYTKSLCLSQNLPFLFSARPMYRFIKS